MPPNETPQYIYRDDLSNPEYRQGADRQPTSSNPLIEMGAGMLKFGVAMMVLRRASGKVASGVFKRMTKGNDALAKRITEGAGRMASAQKGISGMGLVKGVTHALTEHPSVFRGINVAGSKWLRALSSASTAASNIGKGARNAHARLQSSKVIGARRVGKIAGAMAKAAPTAMGFYALGRPLGLLDHDPNLPSWYNVPGHLGQMAKMTAEFAAFDKVMHGISPAFKGAAKWVGNKVEKNFNYKAAPTLHRMADKYLGVKRMGDGSVRAGAFFGSVIEANARAQQARVVAHTMSEDVAIGFRRLFGRKAERSAQHAADMSLFNTKMWKNSLAKARSEGGAEYKSRKKAALMGPGNTATDVVDMLSDTVAKYHKADAHELRTEGLNVLKRRPTDDSNAFRALFGTSGEGGGFVNRFRKYIDTESNRAQATMGGRILKKTQATADDILLDSDKSYAQSLFRHLHDLKQGQAGVGKQIDLLEESFKKMYVRGGVKKAQGGVIDYSMYSPRNMLSSAVEAASPFLSIPYGKGKELPILKVMGLNTMLARKGLAVRAMGMEEDLYFKKAIDGVTQKDWTHISMGHKGADKSGSHGLAGINLDGELWMTQGGTTELYKIDAPLHKMVFAQPYSRRAQLYRSNANALINDADTIKKAAERAMYQDKTASSGMKQKLLKFADDRDWSLSTSFVGGIMRKAQDMFGIGPRTKIFRSAQDILMNPKSGDMLTTDYSMLLNNFLPMGENASKNLAFTLSDPRVLRRMAKLQRAGMKSKDGGKALDDLAGVLEKGGDDRQFMDLMFKRYGALDDHEMKYAFESFYQTKSLNLRDAASMGVGFGSRQLNRKQELMRTYITDAMGMAHGMGDEAVRGTTFNLAKEMIKDSNMLKFFSRKEMGGLRVMSTMVDLYSSGAIKRRMYQSGTQSYSSINQKAHTIISDHFKGHENVLLQHLRYSPVTKGQGGFLRDKRWVDREYDNIVKGVTSQFSAGKSGSATASPYIMTPDKGLLPMDFTLKETMNNLADRVMGMGNWFGLKYSHAQRADKMIGMPDQVPLIGGRRFELGGPLKMFGRRIAQGIGVMAAAQAADAFTDANPLFAGTMLDEGINVAAAEVGIKSALAFHKVKDISGITDASKYLEGLMPGSTSTLPGAVAGGMMFGPLGIPLGMIANRFMGKMMLPELDKSYEEMMDVYSGRELVPVRKGRFWAFSKGDYSGDGVQYYRPHWFPRLKSQYKYTDSLYGSKAEAFLYKPWAGLGFNPVGHILDKYHYEKKHYNTRPYATTEPAFTDVPIIGPILGATIGRLPVIGKQVKRMHQEEMEHYYSTKGATRKFGEFSESSVRTPNYTENLTYMKGARNPDGTAARELRGGTLPSMNPYGIGTMLGEQAYGFTEAIGLRGFQAEALLGGHPYDMSPRYSTPKDMWSTRRAFWDMNLGDIFFSTEFFRRFVPREKKVWEKVNPLRNRMPRWLPGDESDYYINFLQGDPYTKVQEGELRLPGPGYGSAYDVRHEFPGRASSLGKRTKDIVRWMTGLSSVHTEEMEEILEEGTQLHREIQQNLLSANVGIKEEALVYDARNDIIGHIDLVMNDPSSKGGKRALEIKTVHGEKFAKLNKPIPTHVSQINFYISQLQGGNRGTLLYVNRDDPSQVKTFDVRYSAERLRRDILNMEKARQIAAGVVADGSGFEDGASYSWMDRFRILSDVAPTSKEYKHAEKIVMAQQRAGRLMEEDIAQIDKIRKHRRAVLRKYDLYPTRFKGRVFDPDPEYELMSDNENIKAAGEYNVVERTLGSLWERFTQMNTPIHTKLWNYRTPLQHYQRTRLYGTETAFWTKPYQDIVRPMYRQAIATDNPFDAATSFGWIGGVGFPFGTGGGPLGFAAGSIGGAAYGLARSIVGGDAWIPDEIKRKREIERTFDELKYRKAMDLHAMTGDEKYLTDAEHTMYSIRGKGYEVGMGTALRSLSNFEKPYFKAFIAESDKEAREQILQSVPTDVGKLLRVQWNRKNKQYAYKAVDGGFPVNNSLGRSDWHGLSMGAGLEDVKIKTIENEGMNAHDFGLGWYDDMRRIKNSPHDIDPIDIDHPEVSYNPKNIDVAGLKRTLETALAGTAYRPLVYVGYTPGGDGASVQLNVTRDRRAELTELIRGY